MGIGSAVPETGEVALFQLVLRAEQAERLGEALLPGSAGGVEAPTGIGEEHVVDEGERRRGPFDVGQHRADAHREAAHSDAAGR